MDTVASNAIIVVVMTTPRLKHSNGSELEDRYIEMKLLLCTWLLQMYIDVYKHRNGSELEASYIEITMYMVASNTIIVVVMTTNTAPTRR